jgi:hypothetical protein
MAELIFKDEVYAIISAAMDVYNTADFVAYDKIIIEIKALDKLDSREEAQLLNDLKATSSPLGLLVNFGSLNDLEWKRMVATDYRLKFYCYSRTIRED